MSWFRTNVKNGSRLALLALALQFALAFGHVHWFAAQALDTPAAAAAQLDTGSSPDDQDRDQQPSGDGCAICAVMAMAQSVLLSPAPGLTLPQAVDFRQPMPPVASVGRVAIDTVFQPRAPPTT